jgi:hypothetical protein
MIVALANPSGCTLLLSGTEQIHRTVARSAAETTLQSWKTRSTSRRKHRPVRQTGETGAILLETEIVAWHQRQQPPTKTKGGHG